MPSEPELIIAKCRASSTASDPAYRTALKCGRHESVADERPSRGGQDAGPMPFEYVLGGLGACTAITLRMYAQRKGWEIGTVDVSVALHQGRESRHVERRVILSGALSDEQRERLAEICEKTPVTLVVKAGIPVNTRLTASA